MCKIYISNSIRVGGINASEPSGRKLLHAEYTESNPKISSLNPIRLCM